MVFLIGPSTSIGTLKAIVPKVSKKKDEEVKAYVSKMSNNKDAPRKYSLINHICSGPGWYLDKYDLGLEGCLQEVMQDPQCEMGAMGVFAYGLDNNCCCKKVGVDDHYPFPCQSAEYQRASTYQFRLNLDLMH